MDALEIALAALEDAHARYLRSARCHAAALLGLGVTVERMEPTLRQLDEVERQQDALVASLREMA